MGRGLKGVLQFGYEIGTGARTFLPTAAPHVIAAYLVFAVPTLSGAVLLGAAFGVGRGLQNLIVSGLADRGSFLEGWLRPVSMAAPFAPAVAAVGLSTLLS